MASQSAKAFQAFMEAKDFKVSILDDEARAIRVSYNLDVTDIDIAVFFGEDDKNVHIKGVNFVKVPADKQDIIYKICNQCNSDFRWSKFIWNEEHECVEVEADAIIEPNSCAEECFEIIMRLCGIVKEAYPTIMKALWG